MKKHDEIGTRIQKIEQLIKRAGQSSPIDESFVESVMSRILVNDGEEPSWWRTFFAEFGLQSMLGTAALVLIVIQLVPIEASADSFLPFQQEDEISQLLHDEDLSPFAFQGESE